MKLLRYVLLSLILSVGLVISQAFAVEPDLPQQPEGVQVTAAAPAKTPVSPAVPQPVSSKSKKAPNRFERYYERVSDKFDFGAENFMLGWTEWVSEPADYYQKKPGILNRTGNTFIGLGRGFVIGTLDACGGFGNAATALLPQFQIPLPQGGVDLKRIAG